MVTYVVFILVTILFVLFEKLKLVNALYIRIIYLTFLILFSGFRYDVGWDYKSYSRIIDSLRYYGEPIYDKGELLSNLLFLITSKFDSNLFFFLTSSIIIYILISKTLNKYSANYYISLFFFLGFPLFYLNSLSVVRNFIAIAICFWAYKYLEKNQVFKYILAVIVAFLFHKTALIAFFLILLRNIRINKFFSIILVASSFFLSDIFNKMSEFINITGYSFYFNVLEEGANHGGTKAIYMLMFFFLLMLLVHNNNVSKEANFFYNSFLFGIFFYNSMLDMGTIAHRGTLYLTIYGLLALPEYLNMYKKEKIFIYYLVYCACIFLFFYTIYITKDMSNGPYIPYKISLF